MKHKITKIISKNSRELTIVALIILLSTFVQIRTGGRFLSGANVNECLREMSMLAVCAMGMMLVILTGGIDLSIGAVMALSGFVCGLYLKHNPTIPVIVLIVMSIAIGTILGLINGFIVSKLKVVPLIATLGTQNIYRGLTYVVSGGEWVNQKDMTEEFLALSTDKIFGINKLVLIAIIVYVLGYLFLRYIRTGRYIYAVGNSESAARVSGIHVDRVYMTAYTIMGALSGLAGIMWATKYAYVSSLSAEHMEMNAIASVVLGGVLVSGGSGKVPGVILGVVLFGILNNALPLINVSQFWQQGIRGFIILFAIVVNALTQRNSDKHSMQRRII